MNYYLCLVIEPNGNRHYELVKAENIEQAEIKAINQLGAGHSVEVMPLID